MKRVPGHKGWWKVVEYTQTGYAMYKFYTAMGRESRIFIMRENKLSRSTAGHKYEVYLSGAGKGGTALYRDGASTLAEAIKRADGYRRVL